MIIVPETTRDPEFDPDYPPSPASELAGHILPVGTDGIETAARRYGAMFMGFKNRFLAEKQQASPADDEQRLAILARTLLDYSVVKDAITRLHREDDEQMAKLAAYDGARIGDMLQDHDRFLRAQESKYAAEFSGDRQRSLFQKMTADYFAQSRRSARALRNRKIDAFREEVIERQNREFVDRALRPENVFDDAMQTGYRDMLLFNIDNLCAELPDEEKTKRLDAASRAFYEQVMAKRLKLDPSRLRAMLDAPAVRRVLGEKRLRELEDKTTVAIRDDELAAAAFAWADEGCAPTEAAARAKARFGDGTDGKTALRYYRFWRLHDNRRRFLEFMVWLRSAWKTVAANAYRHAAIPAAVRRNQPIRYRFLCRLIETRSQTGGLPPEPDYSRLAELADNYDADKTMEALRDEEYACRFLQQLGGPDAPACEAALRLLAGESLEEDRRLFDDLALAAHTWRKDNQCDNDSLSGYLARFVKARRIKLEREKHPELTAEEAANLLPAGHAGGMQA